MDKENKKGRLQEIKDHAFREELPKYMAKDSGFKAYIHLQEPDYEWLIETIESFIG